MKDNYDDVANSNDPAIRLQAALKEVVLAIKGQKKLVNIKDFLVSSEIKK